MAKPSYAIAGRRSTRKKSSRYWLLYLMMLPGLLYLLINNYIPMFGIIIAFKKYNYRKGIFGSSWAGLDNFKFLFSTTDAFVITRNTILYNLVFMVVGTVLGVFVAILLNEITKKFFSKLYQTVILFPQLISMVIVSYLAYGMLSTQTGFINNSILKPLGIGEISWYNEPKYWPAILLIVNIWKGLGYSAIMYLSSIVGIDKSYYEAAMLDGASKWQQVRKITLPFLVPTIVMLTILSVGRIFYSDFGLFYQVPMNSGPLYDVTSTIDTYVFRALLQQGNIGMSSAAGLYQSVVGFILVVVTNTIVSKVSPENAMY
ncbi:ABC transporter permease [Caproicibacterium sp. XB1]|uniref:ABC transporter permease n=1 Tax=Caproicibacterium sp. XB1 TaxID=3396405 RepID=UPI0039B6FDA4